VVAAGDAPDRAPAPQGPHPGIAVAQALCDKKIHRAGREMNALEALYGPVPGKCDKDAVEAIAAGAAHVATRSR